MSSIVVAGRRRALTRSAREREPERGIDDLGIVARRLETQRSGRSTDSRPPRRSSGLARGTGSGVRDGQVGGRDANASHAATATDFRRPSTAGRILRTHVLRPTWHFVAPEDIRPAAAADGARVRRADGAAGPRVVEHRRADCSRPPRRTITDRARRRVAALTRRDLGERLADERDHRADGRRIAHIAMRPELDGADLQRPATRQAAHLRARRRARRPDRRPRAPGTTCSASATEQVHSRATVRRPLTTSPSGRASASPTPGRASISRVAASSGFEHAGTTCWHAGLGDAGATDDRALLLPEYDESWAGYRDLRMRPAAPVPDGFDLRRPVLVGGEVRGGLDAQALGPLRRLRDRALRTAQPEAARRGRGRSRAVRRLPATTDRFLSKWVAS